MRTELRIVDLGKRGGKVVKRCLVGTRPAYIRTIWSLYCAVKAHAITLMEAQYWLTERYDSPDKVFAGVMIMTDLYF